MGEEIAERAASKFVRAEAQGHKLAAHADGNTYSSDGNRNESSGQSDSDEDAASDSDSASDDIVREMTRARQRGRSRGVALRESRAYKHNGGSLRGLDNPVFQNNKHGVTAPAETATGS